MNTNLTGLGWFSKIFAYLALEGFSMKELLCDIIGQV